MSSVKCVGLMAAAGAIVSGGLGYYRGSKVRKHIIDDAQKIANKNGGKIPTGGMTKDGKLWDGFTTVDEVKKDTKKTMALSTTVNAVAGAIGTAIISALTLFAKSHIGK